MFIYSPILNLKCIRLLLWHNGRFLARDSNDTSSIVLKNSLSMGSYTSSILKITYSVDIYFSEVISMTSLSKPANYYTQTPETATTTSPPPTITATTVVPLLKYYDLTDRYRRLINDNGLI